MNAVISESIQTQQLLGVAAVNYTRGNVCMYNVIWKRVGVTIFAVEKKYLSHILSVYL